ncbi:hypothetical protein AF332_01580 [Sporosarcina globispora]|uniref:Uncharacterized protein n=1 Tax=Sporosarcina globispora TaxID=1459 RepID=A0A0M0G6Y3_SPOGL|nr:hypothetical protein AF332_01580 [Sporosarcina globispora]
MFRSVIKLERKYAKHTGPFDDSHMWMKIYMLLTFVLIFIIPTGIIFKIGMFFNFLEGLAFLTSIAAGMITIHVVMKFQDNEQMNKFSR